MTIKCQIVKNSQEKTGPLMNINVIILDYIIAEEGFKTPAITRWSKSWPFTSFLAKKDESITLFSKLGIHGHRNFTLKDDIGGLEAGTDPRKNILLLLKLLQENSSFHA